MSVADFPLASDDIKHICQNGQTLQVLNIGGCEVEFQNRTKLLQDLFTNCPHLTELNISADYDYADHLLDLHLQALVDKLTPTILKVNLAFQRSLRDEHVKTLVKRCNKITQLDLSYTQITNDSVQSIIIHLNTSLEKLRVSQTEVDSVAIHELKSVTTLKTLIYDYLEDIENLKQQLPHIRIGSEEDLQIASPFKIVNFSYVKYLIWEIRLKPQNLFAKVWVNN